MGRPGGNAGVDPGASDAGITEAGAGEGGLDGAVGTPGAGDAARGGEGGGGGPEASAPATTSECLARAQVAQLTDANSSYRGTPPDGSTVDARTASWTLTDGWVAGTGTCKDVCWVGGEFFLTVDDIP